MEEFDNLIKKIDEALEFIDNNLKSSSELIAKLREALSKTEYGSRLL